MRCRGATLQGRPCPFQAVPGTEHCRRHGDNWVEVQRAAREMAISATPHAVETLYRIATQRPRCQACGRVDDAPSVLKACQLLLDRGGLGPTSTINVNGSMSSEEFDLVSYLTEDQVSILAGWITEAKERHKHGQVQRGVIDVVAEPDTSEPLPSEDKAIIRYTPGGLFDRWDEITGQNGGAS